MQKRKKTLTGELAGTVLILGIAMLVVWVIFYVEIHRLLEDYVMSGMESVSEQVLSGLVDIFLQKLRICRIHDYVLFVHIVDPYRAVFKRRVRIVMRT